TGVSAGVFRSTYITYSLTSGDHTPSFGHYPVAVGVSGTFTSAGDTFVVHGGCPLINDFDVVTPTGSAVMAMTYGAPAADNGAVIRKATGNARVTLSGFSFIYIRDDAPEGIMDRVFHLEDILCSLGDCPDWIQIDVPPSAGTNTLGQNYPNPFNPQTTIAFSLKARGRVRIDVFDVSGARVRTLLDETRATGVHTDVRWDGTNALDQPVASGVYFYRIEAGDFSQTRKMVLLK
ncbi:MAG TPA: T9SS type A sorting domain-containing protein, partial [Candidatus Krumholzibacteria bacterium]|nr:T9SS type A sorting domain-containing protein [Candidatus Krumholzibacteria bacterium]